MKTTTPQPLHTSQSGFTLIEMIGVLAVMAIIAATITPNALRMLDRAAVRAEADTLHNLGEQVQLYLRDNGIAPTAANWNTVLATYASLSPADLLYNRRQNIPAVPPNNPLTQTNVAVANGQNFITRVFVVDPVAANQRAMFISSMRNGVRLPNNLLPTPTPTITAADFATIWSTINGSVPTATGWNVAWNVANIEFLVIERVNLSSIYRTDLQNLSITLNNKGSVIVSYILVLANGTVQPAVNIAVGATTMPPLTLRPKDRLNLYRAADGVTLDYSYMVSTSPKTFDFKDGTNWTPQ